MACQWNPLRTFPWCLSRTSSLHFVPWFLVNCSFLSHLGDHGSWDTKTPWTKTSTFQHRQGRQQEEDRRTHKTTYVYTIYIYIHEINWNYINSAYIFFQYYSKIIRDKHNHNNKDKHCSSTDYIEYTEYIDYNYNCKYERDLEIMDVPLPCLFIGRYIFF